MAARKLTEAHTETPCKYGDSLHIKAPSRQPVSKENRRHLSTSLVDQCHEKQTYNKYKILHELSFNINFYLTI